MGNKERGGELREGKREKEGELREGKRDEIVPGESSFGLLSHATAD